MQQPRHRSLTDERTSAAELGLDAIAWSSASPFQSSGLVFVRRNSNVLGDVVAWGATAISTKRYGDRARLSSSSTVASGLLAASR
jgi:hypothetical protein